MKLFLFAFLLFLAPFYFSSAYSQPGPRPVNYDLIIESPYSIREFIKFFQIPLIDSLSLVRKDSKYGIVDSTNQEVVPCIYDQISTDFKIREDLLIKKKWQNEYFYFFWEDGNESEEIYAQLLEQELNLPNSALNLINKFKSDPIFAAQKDGKWGAINKLNEIIIPFEYSSLQEIGQDIYIAKKEGKSGIIDSQNKILVPIIADTIVLLGMDIDILYREAYALIKANDKYGAMNLYTEKIIQPKYDSLEYCFPAPEDGCYCSFSQLTSWRSTNAFRYKIHSYRDMIRFQIENKIGLLNIAHMSEIISASYDSLGFVYRKGHHSSKGAIVKIDGKYSFLTLDNLSLHPNVYDEISILSGYGLSSSRPYRNYYKIENNSLIGILDRTGKKLLNTKWDDVICSQELADTSTIEFIVKRNGKFGVINNHQKVVIPIKYDAITRAFDEGSYYLLKRKGKYKKVDIYKAKK